MHGNPWFRLLRHEVEALVKEKSGKDHLHKKKLQKELSDLNKEARKLKSRLKVIERDGRVDEGNWRMISNYEGFSGL